MLRTAICGALLMIVPIGSSCAAEPPAPADRENNPAHLLALARAETGGAAWDHYRFLHLTLKHQSGDATLAGEAWIDTLQGRVGLALSDRQSVSRWGFDGRLAWAQAADKPAAPADAGTRSRLISEAFWRSFGWVKTPSKDLTIGGARLEKHGGREFDIVQVTPSGGAQMELWFDRSSHLPVRIVIPSPDREETIRLSDWRKFHEISVPWRIDIAHSAEHSTNDQPTEETVTDVGKLTSDPIQFGIPTATLDFQFPRNTMSVDIPTRIVNDHIIVQGKIDKTRLALLVDTAATSSLNLAYALSAGLSTEQPSVRLPELSVGGVVFRRLQVDLRDLSALSNDEGVQVDGVLGLDVLSRLVVEIDYEGRRLVWVKPDGFVAPPSASSVPLTLIPAQGSLPAEIALPVRIDGVAAELALETASNAGLSMNPDYVSYHGVAARWHLTPAVFDLGGTAVAGQIGRAGSVEIGVLGIAQPVLTVPSVRAGQADGSIGGAILRQFDTIIDYPHGKLLLQESGSPDRPDVVDHAGLMLVDDHDSLKVAGLAPDGPAARAGLRVGDLIHSAGGEKVSAASLPAIRAMLTGLPGDGVTFGIDRGSESRLVRIVLRDPLEAPHQGQ